MLLGAYTGAVAAPAEKTGENTALSTSGEAEPEGPDSDTSTEENEQPSPARPAEGEKAMVGKPVPPEERFRSMKDGTVLDQATGLMWTEDANLPAKKMPWDEAQEYLGKMNRGDLSGYGYSDWRFPTVKEFESLVDKAYTDPALPPGNPFRNVKNDYYWSGSTGHYIADYAWVMDMAYGFVHFDYRSYCNYLYLWPVRSTSKAE